MDDNAKNKQNTIIINITNQKFLHYKYTAKKMFPNNFLKYTCKF